MLKLSNTPFILEKSVTNDQACLLLHGLGGGVYEMQLLGEYLHQQGLDVQGINYPGHDQPVSKMPASTWQQWYAYIIEVYQKLTQKYAAVSVVGFSTGCPLGLYLAASNPIQKLVLLSPFLAVKHEWYYLFRPEIYLSSIFGQMIDSLPRLRLPIRDKAMRQLAEEVAFFKTFNLISVKSAIELINIVKPLIPKIDVPTLIVQSLKDTVVDPAGASFIYRQLGSRTKRLHWLQESDHIILLDRERESVFAQIAAFLK
ncbi:MAG: alpha/beta fold hydrolase [Chroococcidiopsidaceae cyanobacterium CP_BM_ER_R8_30]|nr:alpha/beta fold hydrolase [Chroococcidiopsidaceae cyanobacterium CP_BM_ER_R8_30]